MEEAAPHESDTRDRVMQRIAGPSRAAGEEAASHGLQNLLEHLKPASGELAQDRSAPAMVRPLKTRDVPARRP
jgi:hypothetical protein